MRSSARRRALAAVTVLAAVAVGAGQTGSAQAAGPCKGSVKSWWKADGIVRMTYQITCTRKVDVIALKAFLREGDRWSRQDTVTCRNTTHCVNVETLRDRDRVQWYFGRAYEGTYPPSTYVKDNGNVWPCNAPRDSGIPCGGGSKQY
jgi:hypothetical protein